MKKQIKLLLQENNQLEEALTKENQILMTDIVCYIRSFNITMTHQEFVRKDIIHMLINAQNNNQGSQDVFGEDYKQFCDDIIQELPKMSKRDKVMVAIGNNCLYLMILLIIMFLTKGVTLLKNPATFPIMTIKTSELLQIAIIIFVAKFIVQFICKTALQELSKTLRYLIIGGLAITVVSVFIGSYVFELVTFDINLFVFLIIILGLFILQKYIEETYE